MEVTKNQEITAADKKSVGFDYQFLYFVYKALDLKPGEKIGYEVKDDVHLELEDGHEVFVQLKHSLQIKKNMDIINMTEKDSDLWKSLYNWNLSINEIDEDKRLDYINKIEFVLVTNKNNENNKFFTKTKEFSKGSITAMEYKKYILELHNSIEGDKPYSNNLKKYMKIIINQKDDILKSFVKKLNFTLGFDNLVKKIKDQILSKHIDERKLEEIFERCIGILSIWKYENIKNGERVFISFEDIDKSIKHCFIYGRNDKFPRNLKDDIDLPDKLQEQNFIKELIEINDLDSTKLIKIAKYTTFKLKLENLLESWIQENYLTETDKEQFINECISLWSNYHVKSHRNSNKAIRKDVLNEEDLKELLYENAVKCLDDVRTVFLELCGEKLNIEESNGTFYSLSQHAEIGWKIEWQRRY
ncbi:hypothetical protein [Clostridium gasigenes]|uniref:hypothetical protein n=1 Tax=Clostridium gasigenes TaxID=94869 RepID=UPI001C0ADECB|nr:hypothetical protein [Clostridium gasigenes]MBU3109862.1 hypothetical protein [Clostridium gasigenes]